MANEIRSKTTISFSTATIIKILVILAMVGFAWMIRDIVTLLFVSVVLASALDPTIDYFQRLKIPRSLSVILIYIVVLSLLSFTIVKVADPIANEVRTIASDFPRYYEEVNSGISQWFEESPQFFTDARLRTIRGGLDAFITNMTQVAQRGIYPIVSTIFGGIVSLVLMLVITFYFIVQEDAVKQFIMWLTPKKNSEGTIELINRIQHKLGLWLRGQIILSLIIFTIIYVSLKVLHVKYALILALLAGLFEIIPYLGPILAAIPAIFLTLTSTGLFKAVLVVILYVIVQQIENHLIVPNVMSKAVGINPLIIIFSILIGAKLAGVVGAIVAIPVATAVMVFLQEKGYVHHVSGEKT